jgi:hypothetical protein
MARIEVSEFAVGEVSFESSRHPSLAASIRRVDPAQGIRPIWGYILVGLVIVAIFPWISIGFL